MSRPMYLLHLHTCPTFEQAERRFQILHLPAALLKYPDGRGGVAMLAERPLLDGQAQFEPGAAEIRRNFA